MYRVVGTGTDMMTHLKEGDTLDCLGPLGSRFEMTDNMLLVGGGVGIAPMLCIASKLNEIEDTTRYTNEEDETVIKPVAAKKATVVLGFRNESETFWADLFKAYDVPVYVTTDDGSVGTKGFPTAIMPELIQSERGEVERQLTPFLHGEAETGEIATDNVASNKVANIGFTSVLTCGPTPMMKGVAQVAADFNVLCQVSLEERMGCGTGGCLGCGCNGRGGKRYKVCKDGPVFAAEEVFFNE